MIRGKPRTAHRRPWSKASVGSSLVLVLLLACCWQFDCLLIATGRHATGLGLLSCQPAYNTSVNTDLLGLVQSYPNKVHHNRHASRVVLALTATPLEITRLEELVRNVLNYQPYNMFDAIHISIPFLSTRFQQQPYPTVDQLRHMFPDPKVILHRLADYGPLTRYMGALAYERHPETRILAMDVDSQNMDWQHRGFVYKSSVAPYNLVDLVHISQQIDKDAVWCWQGEDFKVQNGTVSPAWDTFPHHQDDNNRHHHWNQVHFCRATAGILIKPKHFVGFWYNQTDYHPSCLWDDDRWLGFQMERLGHARKALHPQPHQQQQHAPPWHHHRRRLGSLSGLTQLNTELQSAQTCTMAWLQHHPETFQTAIV